MRRKVIKQSDSYTVTLPIKWVRSNNLEKNDEIEVDEKGNALVFSTERKLGKLKKIDLDATSMDFNDIYLCYCYRVGYDEVKINFKSAQVFDRIKDRTNTLIGYEIMKQKEDSCLVKSVSVPRSSEFDTFFRRLFLTTLDMGESLFNALKNKNLEKLKEIRSIERTNNTFFEFISRILYQEGYKDDKKTLFIYNINRDVERICDSYKYMIDYLLQNKRINVSKETLNYFERINKYIRAFYELFYKFDKGKLDKINRSRYELIKRGYQIYEKANHKEGAIVFHLITIIQIIFDLVGPVYCINFEELKP